jgi:hypothetical protein
MQRQAGRIRSPPTRQDHDKAGHWRGWYPAAAPRIRAAVCGTRHLAPRASSQGGFRRSGPARQDQQQSSSALRCVIGRPQGYARSAADLLGSFGMMAPPMRHADEADLGAGSRLSAPAFLVRLSPERGFTGAGMRNSGPNWAVPLVAGGWQLLHLAHGRGADHPNHLNESGGVLCRGSSGPSAAHPGSLGPGIASGWRARALPRIGSQ